MASENWKPCKLNPKNLGLHCEAQSGCEKCGWNPKKTANKIGTFNAESFKTYLECIDLTVLELAKLMGTSEQKLYTRIQGRVAWTLNDIVKMSSVFRCSPQLILEKFFNFPKAR